MGEVHSPSDYLVKYIIGNNSEKFNTNRTITIDKTTEKIYAIDALL